MMVNVSVAVRANIGQEVMRLLPSPMPILDRVGVGTYNRSIVCFPAAKADWRFFCEVAQLLGAEWLGFRDGNHVSLPPSRHSPSVWQFDKISTIFCRILEPRILKFVYLTKLVHIISRLLNTGFSKLPLDSHFCPATISTPKQSLEKSHATEKHLTKRYALKLIPAWTGAVEGATIRNVNWFCLFGGSCGLLVDSAPI